MTHYFDQKQNSEHAYRAFEAAWEGTLFRFTSDSGVFSRRQVDDGTHLLVSTVLSCEADAPIQVLDLGTGIGVMAIALAGLRPSFRVLGSDINERAVSLARRNASLNGVRNASFLECDGVPVDGACEGEPVEGSAGKGARYDLIILNPPIRAGKETVYRLFREAREHLNEGGRFYIVIRVRQGAASAAKELAGSFDIVETINRGKGYHVIRACVPKSGG